MPDTIQTPMTTALQPGSAWTDYSVALMQRHILFLDVLRQRGNQYHEHLAKTAPTVLSFDAEMVADGADLPRPVNYSLLKVVPPQGVVIDPIKRPFVIVDPRAGHGPGIGGFKPDSEIGVALRAGHPCYFVSFLPKPVLGQTVTDVVHAEAAFLEHVIAAHPAAEGKPVVIGNCQAGWQIMIGAALRPELFGPIIIAGAPLSYWAGRRGGPPMRYAGGLMGGSWVTALAGDLGHGLFDGSWLVENFESLDPANTLFSKQYNLHAHVDTEPERYLGFERWWNNHVLLNAPEMQFIVDKLFIGNRLATAELVMDDGARVDLRKIRSPIVVFCSKGDNITPPPQALGWITDLYGSINDIRAHGQTIVYAVHESVGHLGIFVGGSVALKEHDQLVSSLDVIESLPPGLYEMKLERKDGQQAQRWDALEPGDYTVQYQHRTMDDLRRLNPEGREEEAVFSTVSQWSQINAQFYKTWVRPWVRMTATRESANALMRMNPLRMQRQLFSDAHPAASFIRQQAAQARARRVQLDAEHPLKRYEQRMAQKITDELNAWRDQRDARTVRMTRQVFGPNGLGAVLPPREADAEVAQRWAQEELGRYRSAVIGDIAHGGFAEAVCRIVIAGMISVGVFERRSLRLARLLAQLPGMHASVSPQTNWVQLLKEQARVTAVAPVEALNALQQMLPDRASRERALALSAAVMMIEPTLANPRSEIIELLIGTLDVDPGKVIALARKLTTAIGEFRDEITVDADGDDGDGGAIPPSRKAPATPRKSTRKSMRKATPAAVAKPVKPAKVVKPATAAAKAAPAKRSAAPEQAAATSPRARKPRS